MNTNFEVKPLEDLIKHELGHYYIANELNFETGNITITEHDGSCNIQLRQNIKNKKEFRTYIENRICILLAGMQAEIIKTKEYEIQKEDTDKLQSISETTALNDQSKAIELIYILLNYFENNIKENDELDKINRYLAKFSNKAAYLIRIYIDEINYIAKKLSNKEENIVISKDEIKKYSEEYKRG